MEPDASPGLPEACTVLINPFLILTVSPATTVASPV
jgi:hypothetical protein